MVPKVDVRVSGEMLFAPLVFLAALALCVVLNLLSALIPAYSLVKPIVNSLNENDKTREGVGMFKVNMEESLGAPPETDGCWPN